MKFTGPKVKKSRSLGIALSPKAARIMERRPNSPGQHGATTNRKKKSDYALQLLEKQRLRFQYNVHERQMRKYMRKAARMKGNQGDNLMQLLETRLDAFVLRAGFAKTIYAARQYVNHRHVLVNGKRVDVPNYKLSINDEVSIRNKSKKMDCFHDAMQNSHVPPYIDLSKSDMKAKFLYIPSREEIPVICNVSFVVEFYNR